MTSKNIFSIDEINSKSKIITRYMKLEDLYKSLQNNSMYFANPKVWEDPFEEAVMKNKFFNSHSLFSLCFTTSASLNEEAFWVTCKSHSRKKFVSISFDCEKFIVQLNIALKKSFPDYEFNIYYGNVNYNVERKDQEKRIKELKEEEISIVKTLFIKRKAYSYENEFRIVIISDKKIPKHTKGIVVQNFELAKLINRIRLEPLSKPENKKLEKDDKKDSEIKKIKEKEIQKLEEISPDYKNIKITISRLDDFPIN